MSTTSVAITESDEPRPPAPRCISLRGVEVHNLKGIDLDIPHRKLVVLCGLSGSGKTSLALDTLYAEGQRRYIESFSAYSRQFLERLEKPDAERIDGIPPAIAVTHRNTSRSSRSTVGTTTETTDYLRLLLAKIGRLQCLSCGQPVRRESPQSTSEALLSLPPGLRYLVAFPLRDVPDTDLFGRAATLQEEGFRRVIIDDEMLELPDERFSKPVGAGRQIFVVVDRLTAGSVTPQRLRDSLETAFARGGGACAVFAEGADRPQLLGEARGAAYPLNGQSWWRLNFSSALRCDNCGLDYPEPEPRLFSFNSPLGACPICEGYGNVTEIDMDLVVPDKEKTIRQGAIAPWNTPAYEHELQELIAAAGRHGVPLDVPFRELNEEQLRIIREGVPAANFGGLRGFFRWLERHKYKMHLRVFLSRWRSYHPCPACQGDRLRPEALAFYIGGRNIAQICRMQVSDAIRFFRSLELEPWEQAIARLMLDQLQARLKYLEAVGLGYLTLDRTLRTLSGGESQRVALTSALGSSLVNMLYVLDEPSVGLHPTDVDRLLESIIGLRNRGNSVVVVEHEESMIRAADQVIEIGPGAGERGGQVVFQGTPAELESSGTLTADYLARRRGIVVEPNRRPPRRGSIRLTGARGNNLKNLTVDFPLGLLCLVTGVSGSGKSTLVQDTLYPALCSRLKIDAPKPLAYDEVFGDGQIDEVILVDQSPIGRSARSNPVTYLKAFDEIRSVFADTVEAKTRNYTAGHFSFNVEGGRCSACEGQGYIAIDMQFLADIYMKCSQCGGKRYRPEILKVKYRGRSIADVLDMTVCEAFGFFRGSAKVQARLKKLIDVGLDYLRLGQPADTLSGGEAQRLKLAGYMSGASRRHTLFILDEPTTGLHFNDVIQLLDCFDALLAVGHSLIVVEHNLQLMKSADHIIDLGPGAAEQGGHVVASGTPEAIAANPNSLTGKFLGEALERDGRQAMSDEP